MYFLKIYVYVHACACVYIYKPCHRVLLIGLPLLKHEKEAWMSTITCWTYLGSMDCWTSLPRNEYIRDPRGLSRKHGQLMDTDVIKRIKRKAGS